MVQTYFPFSAGSGDGITEERWTKMAKYWLGTGVLQAELNKLQVYADSTGMQVKVKTGAAWIQGHYYESSAEEILPIATANATNPRIDRIILRLNWTDNTIGLAVLQGTPAASPTAPAVTRNFAQWELSLAQVRVNAGVITITAANVTDERTFTNLFSRSYLSLVQTLQEVIAHNTWTKLSFSEFTDLRGEYNSTTKTITVLETGVYLLYGYANWFSGQAVTGKDYKYAVYINGTLYYYNLINYNAATAYDNEDNGLIVTRLNAGDTIEVYAFQNTGVTKNIANHKFAMAQIA